MADWKTKLGKAFEDEEKRKADEKAAADELHAKQEAHAVLATRVLTTVVLPAMRKVAAELSSTHQIETRVDAEKISAVFFAYLGDRFLRYDLQLLFPKPVALSTNPLSCYDVWRSEWTIEMLTEDQVADSIVNEFTKLLNLEIVHHKGRSTPTD